MLQTPVEDWGKNLHEGLTLPILLLLSFYTNFYFTEVGFIHHPPCMRFSSAGKMPLCWRRSSWFLVLFGAALAVLAAGNVGLDQDRRQAGSSSCFGGFDLYFVLDKWVTWHSLRGWMNWMKSVDSEIESCKMKNGKTIYYFWVRNVVFPFLEFMSSECSGLSPYGSEKVLWHISALFFNYKSCITKYALPFFVVLTLMPKCFHAVTSFNAPVSCDRWKLDGLTMHCFHMSQSVFQLGICVQLLMISDVFWSSLITSLLQSAQTIDTACFLKFQTHIHNTDFCMLLSKIALQ